MNKKKLGAKLLILGVIGTVIGGFLCVEKIPTGYVGVVYSTSGGVSDEILTEGWRLVAPNKKVTKYSVAKEYLVMSADERAGSKDDDSFEVSCNDGQLNVDFEMQYSFKPENVVGVFKDYRGIDGQTVVSTNLRTRIKTLIQEITSQYSVMEIHQSKKQEVNKALTDHIKEELGKLGIYVDSATLSRTQPNKAVEDAITKRTAIAQQLEEEKQRQEVTRLQAETNEIEAQGKAKVQMIQAQAQADANALLSESISDNLIKKMEMEARLKHGWVEIQGAQTIVTKEEN